MGTCKECRDNQPNGTCKIEEKEVQKTDEAPCCANCWFFDYIQRGEGVCFLQALYTTVKVDGFCDEYKKV
jgi:hypothetical protein